MKQKLPILAALCALFLLILASDTAIERAAYGLRLCWELILPSLFPFFVVSSLLGRLGFPKLAGQQLAPLARRLFRTSGAGITALLIGLTGGYPLGAAYITELEEQGEIGSDEGARLLGFCNNSGPAFLIGAIGTGIFGSSGIGLLLYLSHVLAAVLSGLFRRGHAAAGGFGGLFGGLLLSAVAQGILVPQLLVELHVLVGHLVLGGIVLLHLVAGQRAVILTLEEAAGGLLLGRGGRGRGDDFGRDPLIPGGPAGIPAVAQRAGHSAQHKADDGGDQDVLAIFGTQTTDAGFARSAVSRGIFTHDMLPPDVYWITNFPT